jgi:hypothetical protein
VSLDDGAADRQAKARAAAVVHGLPERLEHLLELARSQRIAAIGDTAEHPGGSGFPADRDVTRRGRVRALSNRFENTRSTRSASAFTSGSLLGTSTSSRSEDFANTGRAASAARAINVDAGKYARLSIERPPGRITATARRSSTSPAIRSVISTTAIRSAYCALPSTAGRVCESEAPVWAGDEDAVGREIDERPQIGNSRLSPPSV